MFLLWEKTDFSCHLVKCRRKMNTTDSVLKMFTFDMPPFCRNSEKNVEMLQEEHCLYWEGLQ
ncbi:hypothetical protein CAY57_17185 [Heyndrickxia coagulans]|nr:hypothetical protein CAY57_17185 [Heyndrickxia coagulans]